MRVGNTLTIGSMSSVGAGIVDPDAQIFIDRVLADGGTVEDPAFLNSFVLDAKANNYFTDIVFAGSPSWGVKGTTTASKLYSLISSAQDLAQTTGAEQPEITSAVVNSKTALSFNGTAHNIGATFTFNRPETIIFGGMRQRAFTNFDRICDGGINFRALISQDTTTPNISINAGQPGAANTDLTINQFSHLRALLASSGTELQVDAETETSGAAAVVEAAGFTIASAFDGTLASNIQVGMVVLLNSSVDGSYDAKMSAIYNFSKSAYGTS